MLFILKLGLLGIDFGKAYEEFEGMKSRWEK
jgi:hypothetical protein